ncbi:MAG: lipopolysaccharide heptosyltransferase II [Nitrospiraceae bacterium]|nr:lipopolysaccharide heptosyltransferase II [Nitrospiraceae bacterium]
MIRILFVKLSAIGDVVLTMPALEAIKKAFPESEIDWVVEEAAAGILEGHPLLRSVIVSRRKTWLGMLRRPATFFAALREMRAFTKELRSREYDIAVDFQGLLKSGLVMGCARARRKIGFDRTRELAYLFLNERLPAYDIERHALDRYLDVARYLGAGDPAPSCSLPIEAERSAILERIKETAGTGRRIVVMNPVARWKTKLWQEEKFAELADRLIEDRNAVVIFTGAPADREVTSRIRERMKGKAIDWTGNTTLKELAALASLSEVFITTDTGPMHLAAAAGARVVALFGPTSTGRTGPYGIRHTVIRAGLDCSPCFSRACPYETVRCMEAISVDQVMEALL